jgi:hypothetical protein
LLMMWELSAKSKTVQPTTNSKRLYATYCFLLETAWTCSMHTNKETCIQRFGCKTCTLSMGG